ncbi:MAG: DUF2085 domain-containing protein [Pyrinomonadaceae bacterium]|nr:DUF2085 domain-containing protein [Pyrinomonadaceae bacterium]
MRATVNEYIPQFVGTDASVGSSLRRPLIAWCITLTIGLLAVGACVLAPVSAAHNYPLLSEVIYKGFSRLCHQIPERSFHVDDHPFAVCARCFGLYAGFAIGVVLYPLLRSLRKRDTPARVWLILAALPTTVDFALGFSGLWENTHLSRSMTGALLGAVAAFYVVPGLVDVSQTDWRRYFAKSS